jgi:hypothetical protein
MDQGKKSAMYRRDHYLYFVREFISFPGNLFPLIHSGGKEPAVNNWQKIVIDIPNDKLVVSVKEARPSHMPTRIQALVVVRQRVNGIRIKSLLNN